MWAAPPLIQWTSPCIPHTQSPTTNPAPMCLPIGVPIPFATTNPAPMCLSVSIRRNFQLYSQLKNLDLGTVEEQKQQNRKKSQQTKHRQQGAEEKEENKLSGFDVLRALEKAAAQKRKKKRNGRESSLLSSGNVTGQGRKRTPEDEALADYGNKNVGPLSIKEDWGTRLDELETKLEELVETAAT